MPKGPGPPTDEGQPQPLHGLKLVIKEEALPLKEQPEFPTLALLASRGLLAPDAWKCKRAQVSLKATIDVPMLVQSSNKMAMGFWKIPTCQWDGRYTLMVPSDNVAFIDLQPTRARRHVGEYDMKRDLVEIITEHPNGLITQCGTENIWNQSQDTHCDNCGLTPSRHWAQIIPVL